MEEMICIENVTKQFKNEQVIKGIDLTFSKGKIYGIVGKNGSGKTVRERRYCLRL